MLSDRPGSTMPLTLRFHRIGHINDRIDDLGFTQLGIRVLKHLL